MSHDVDLPLQPMGMGIDEHAVLYRSTDRVFRAIHPRSAGFYREVLEQPVVQRLMERRLLIPTAVSQAAIPGHDLVLEHPLVPVVSFPFEWTPTMFKEAAITLLKLNIELTQSGYCTHDAHPWNLLFDGVTPVFVDFTSIINLPDGVNWRGVAQFKNHCVNPLLLMAAGHPTATRALLREIFCYPDPVLVEKVVKGRMTRRSWDMRSVEHAGTTLLASSRRVARRYARGLGGALPPSIKHRLKALMPPVRARAAQPMPSREGSIEELQKLLRTVEALDVRPPVADWSNYYAGRNELPIYDGSIDNVRAIGRATAKHQHISDVLARVKPKSVLDLGCNRGLYSQLAAFQGARVVGIDIDERTLDDMYRDSRRLQTTALPLYVSAVAPAEAIGFKENPFPSVTTRLRSELVMCLGLVHHLVFKTTRMTFGHIAKLLDSLAEKYVVVEFVPIEDPHIRGWYREEFAWYTFDRFRSELARYFSNLQVFESFPAPRVLVFGQKA